MYDKESSSKEKNFYSLLNFTCNIECPEFIPYI